MPASPEAVSILYVSCRKFSDLWENYFTLFRRHWPDCPYPIHIVTEAADKEIPGTRLIRTGTDLSWSDNLLFALERIESSYVLLLLDDFFLVEPVMQDWVAASADWLVGHQHHYLRLCNDHPKPVGHVADRIGLLPPGAHYRNSTRFAIWKKSTMQALLKPGETAWQFELDGSIRSDAYDGFYCAHVDAFRYANCVIKGKWNPLAVSRVRACGIQLDLSTRPQMPLKDMARNVFDIARMRLLSLVPYRWRRRVRARFLGGNWK